MLFEARRNNLFGADEIGIDFAHEEDIKYVNRFYTNLDSSYKCNR